MAAHQALLLRPVAVATSSSSPFPAISPAGQHSFSTPLSQLVLSSTAPTAPFSAYGRGSHRRLLLSPINAAPGAVLGVEPDLEEDYVEGSEFKTAGEDTQEADFPYGKLDGSHSYHKGDDNLEFFAAWRDAIEKAGGPNDNPFQATISWFFLPVIFSGLAFGVQAEYLFLITALFVVSFIAVEITKPDKPSNFEYDPNFPGPGYKP